MYLKDLQGHLQGHHLPYLFYLSADKLVRLLLILGIPPNVVMKWTGHSDYKAMKPYIDIVDSIKVNAMRRFD